MIIIRLSGGIGNQLFQYALGRSLSIKSGSNLKFDISDYKNGLRKFALHNFNIPEAVAGIASESDFTRIGVPPITDISFYGRVKRKLFRISEYIKPIHEKKFIVEPSFNFTPDILRIQGDSFLSGVWQSEKYFADIRKIILRELTLRHPLTTEGKKYKELIESSNSVALHIRRGDYVTDNTTAKKHGALSLRYYHDAIKYLENQKRDIEIFIFSDDIHWAQENLKGLAHSHFVSNASIPDYEEIILMKECKHNIIANSTFSWWGAWLNEHKNKIVIAPDKWFQANVNANDLLPNSWIKI